MENEETQNEELDMPLSPVLSFSRNTRKPRASKNIGGSSRRLVGKTKEQLAPATSCLLDDTFTVSQVECIEKLEKLEKTEKGNHKTKPVTEGFTTAAGRKIEVSEERIRTQASLFHDILSGSDNVKDKKYSFLSKSERHRKPTAKPNVFKGLQETEVIECENQPVVNKEKLLVNKNCDRVLGKNSQSFVECSTTSSGTDGCGPQKKQGIFSNNGHFDDFQGFVKPSISKREDLVFKTKPGQKANHIFANENFDDLLTDEQSHGFVKGSTVAMTDEKKNTARPILKKKLGIFANENFDDLVLDKQLQGFKHYVDIDSDNAVLKSMKAGQKRKPIFANENFDDLVLDEQFGGFVKCSAIAKANKDRRLKPPSKTVSSVFAGENFDDLDVDKQFQSFVKPANFQSVAEKKSVLFANENFDDIDLNKDFNGFTKSSSIILEKREHIIEDYNGIAKLGDDVIKCTSVIDQSRKIDKDDCKGFDENEIATSQIKNSIFLASVEAYCSRLLQPKESNMKRRLSFEGDSPAVKKSKLQEDQKPIFLSEGSLTNIKDGLVKRSTSSPGFPIKHEKSTSLSAPSTTKKKRLGISHSKPMHISKENLARARLIFDDVENVIPSPVKSSLPQTLLCSTPIRNTKSNVLLNSTLTPIKHTPCSLNVSRNSSTTSIKDTFTTSYHPTYSKLTFVEESKKIDFNNSCFVLQQPSTGNVELRNKELEDKRICLENELKLIVEKQNALSQQKTLLEMEDFNYRRKRTGALSAKKQVNGRVDLKTLRFNPVYCELSNVTPQNADLFHFNCVNTPSITTTDGAIIIPDLCNLVGLSEIEAGFKTMPGIELKLIPPRWIKNHYKWIVWKLASYERTLPDLKECLSIENVVQQLKYRYDREIDRAERSVLRKIFEKDDAPQKRMVLCVSDVIAFEDELELELTDGWYGIRTVIDKLLCDQVARGKIKVGTKLMICGAELLNCDGCHPLDVTDSVRLKINCNSTRRTKWHVKLGQYQSDLGPYPVSLHSVFPMGGTIGCIKVFVARVYPIKYIEKQGNLNVWRNRKAEERRAVDWENEKMKSIEDVREAIMKDYETSASKSRKNRSLSKNEIKEITCPKTLYDYYKQCGDPDSLNEILTESQVASIKDYDVKLKMQTEREMNSKLRDRLVNVSQRDVTSVLSLLIVDAVTCANSGFIFHIWRPMETHMQIVQEGCVYYIYNVLPKRNGDLSSTSRTKFKAEQAQTTAFEKFKRSVLDISLTCESDNRLLSNEFDTVGIVAQTTIGNFNQNFWLCDMKGRLLFVKIYEGPKTCSLLDHLESGQVVAVSNLKLCETKHEFGQAIANHFTTVSSYPQLKHLQEGFEKFTDELSSKDIKMLLKECNEKISYYSEKIAFMKSESNSSSFLETSARSHPTSILNETCEDSTLVYSRITSTDVAMSMIDFDKYT